MKKEPDPRLAVSIAAVRTTWIAAIVVCALAILSGLLSGANGGDPSLESAGPPFADGSDSPQLLPEVALLEPVPPVRESQMKAQKTKTAAPQDDWTQRAREQAPGDNRSGSQPDDTSGSRPDDTSGGTPVDRSGPDPPQSPSVNRPDPSQSTDPPQSTSVSPPSPPQAPSVTSEPSQVTVETSVPESEVSVSASEESASAQVKAPVSSTDVKVGLG